ncbi:MAG: ABC transporter ATP-binding protein [Chthoniobacteraceae bacterium]
MTPIETHPAQAASRDAPGTLPQVTLATTGLELSYGSTPVLKGIDLEVRRGEFVALLGPSGCGKTSLLRSIAGFVTPQRGSILLDGHDVAGLPPRARNIGLVFQSYALFPHMTAHENVRFGLECRRMARKEADEAVAGALALVGLAAFAGRRPKELSGGQQQRVALARAIVIRPDLLLLDEPLGALDKQMRVQMQTELKLLQKRLGVTAIFVTHDQEEAMSMADRIVVMREGVIEQVAAPEELFANPASAWIGDFIGSGNLLRGTVVREDDDLVELDVGPGCVFRVPRDGKGRSADRVLFVRADRLQVRAATEERGIPVVARRFLGIHVELLAQGARGTLRALMSPDQAASFAVGSHVSFTAEPRDCRLLPDR